MYLNYNKHMQIYSDKCFRNPIEIIEAHDNLESAFFRIEQLQKKFYLLGYITYDFKNLYFEVYENYEKYIPQKGKSLGTLTKPLISKNN